MKVLKDSDEVFAYIWEELETICKDIKEKSVEQWADTDRGVQRWTETELVDAPEQVEIEFIYNKADTDDLIETIYAALEDYRYYFTNCEVRARLLALEMNKDVDGQVKLIIGLDYSY